MYLKPKRRPRVYRARYALTNGLRGTLLLIAHHPCDAVGIASKLLGEAMQRVSVRLAA